MLDKSEIKHLILDACGDPTDDWLVDRVVVIQDRCGRKIDRRMVAMLVELRIQGVLKDNRTAPE